MQPSADGQAAADHRLQKDARTSRRTLPKQGNQADRSDTGSALRKLSGEDAPLRTRPPLKVRYHGQPHLPMAPSAPRPRNTPVQEPTPDTPAPRSTTRPFHPSS